MQLGDILAAGLRRRIFRNPRDRLHHVAGCDLQYQRLLLRRVTYPDIGAALAHRLDPEFGGRGGVENDGQSNAHGIAIGFHLAEKFVFHDFSRRHAGRAETRRRITGFDFKREALAVHVVSRSNAVLGNDVITLHPRGQREGLLRRQQLLFLRLQRNAGAGQQQERYRGEFANDVHRVDCRIQSRYSAAPESILKCRISATA